ncbi:NAD(P)/FAD-dependent oxidoreductase [Shewanella surugensis]|uniref:FAD-binding oxidoreductase n=1 Tax=Shewanella surugensis TaxID=212020 RepID=A0ABT0L8T5_9GAMM|nr:FAD-binding oxidoreductase [Shewanella surugensis]MCL1123762.1 FAD-binding oxidoreductase [Shewanella surugensis]
MLKHHVNFDPLIHDFPHRLDMPDSYWASTQDLPAMCPRLRGTHQTEVAIIGGGYTGLLTAYYLANEFNIDCCVLEANRVGFGGSARNAGFVLKGSGRLGYQKMAKRWDLATAKGIYREFSDAVSRVEGLIQDHHIRCEPEQKGYLKIAHNEKAMTQLTQAARFISEHLGEDAEFIHRDQLTAELMDHKQAYGALRLNDGFGINPLKLLLGYKKLVQAQKVPLFEDACVLQWIEERGKHRLITGTGELTAKKVITVGNAYTPKRFNHRVDNHFLPILSQIFVTEPLTAEQLTLSGLKTHQVTMDTRILKYYYRLLPDNRLLFGGRGAINGKDAHKERYLQRLYLAMLQCFPSLSSINIAYNWTGWIAAAMDDMPHVYEKNGVGYSLGYCGSGVSFSAQAAFRLAQQIAGESVPDLPLYTQALPAFPLPRSRRAGQWAYYHYAWLKDKWG